MYRMQGPMRSLKVKVNVAL